MTVTAREFIAMEIGGFGALRTPYQAVLLALSDLGMKLKVPPTDVADLLSGLLERVEYMLDPGMLKPAYLRDRQSGREFIKYLDEVTFELARRAENEKMS